MIRDFKIAKHEFVMQNTSMEPDWSGAAERMLKAEIAREGITIATLVKRLNKLGVPETEASVKNKLYRGTFSTVFFLQCMRALDRATVDVAAVVPHGVPSGGRALDGKHLKVQ